MSRTAKRLLISLLLSLACMAGTHYWYTSQSGSGSNSGDHESIAQLVEVINEVQRKPLKRLIWQNLSDNESLFGGELIRTNESAQAAIEINRSGTLLELEPETLISLEEREGKIELEFLRGNLYVKGGTDDLVLKVGASRIKMAGAELSLGKGGGSDGDVAMQVIKGKAEVEGGGVKKLKDDFVILSPLPSSEVHVRPENKEQIGFEWKTLPNTLTQAVLEIGKNRNELKGISDQKFDGKNKINAFLPPGEYYWRVVAQSSDRNAGTLVSGVYRVKVLPKRPVVPLFPEKDMSVNTPEGITDVSFRWANPGKLTDLLVEVAESEDLKKNPITQRSTGMDSIEVRLPKSGVYYWRVTGFIGQKREPVSSLIHKFSLRSGGDVAQPVLELPRKGEKFGYLNLKDRGLGMQWKGSSGASQYKIILKDKRTGQSREELSPINQFKWSDLKPGAYEWSVVAINAQNKESKPSEVWNFAIDELPVLQWKDGKDQADYFYWTDRPELFSDWQDGPKGTVQYRVSYRLESEQLESSKRVSTTRAEFKVNTEREGRFIASVEAINKEGLVVAKTNERTVNVKPAPLLPAPQYAVDLPTPLKATRSGTVELSWSSVEQAQAYVVEVKDSSGKLLKEEKTASTSLSLKKMMPGELKITLMALDKAGRRGLASETRSLLVPDMSDVRAPKVKGIKVE